MAPNFLSKLVKQSSSSQQSESPSNSAPRSRASSTPKDIIVVHVPDKSEAGPSGQSAPNFMIIPPSPSLTVNSLGNNSDKDSGKNNSTKKGSNGSTGSRQRSTAEKPKEVDLQLTPTIRHPDPHLGLSSPTAHSRQRAHSIDTPESPSVHGRYATTGSFGISHSTPNRALSNSPSKVSLRRGPPDPLPITVNSRDATASYPLVESPTIDSSPPMRISETLSSTLLAPRASDGDATSIHSASSSKSKKPWNRRSSVSTPKSPKRSQSGLASAIAVSGLAMVQAVAPSTLPEGVSPQFRDQLSNRSTSMLSRHAYKRSRDMSLGQSEFSRSSSLNYQPSEYSGNSGTGSDSDSGSDDELDLSAVNIPVTGFAVASSKRNADFHEQFPIIPEGDYLIEDYGCALQRDILVQGRLYISENHICFHANIFGWITDLSIPMYEIISLEKKMTAFVIPNAIQVITRTAKYTFASFLSRDTTFDVIYNIWRLAQPEESRNPSQRGSFDIQDPNNMPTGGLEATRALPKITRCSCGIEKQHYSEVALESVVPGSPEKIHNLIFASGFVKNFMTDQKLIDLQISDWTPVDNAASPDSKLLVRNMSYIKPLYGSIGPKQTKCELRDEVVHCDYDNYISTITTTRTPDVPSGNVFSVKTRTCITWASSASSRIFVSTQVEWTGRSFIKGIIEKSCIDGQKQYHAELDQAMRVYIQEHQSEFIPEGMDAAEAEAAQKADIVEEPLSPTPLTPMLRSSQERERERNRRSLQWAYDTFDGAFKVAKQSTETALELVGDAWDQSSSATVPWFIIVILVFSNIWTLLMVGSREEVGRRKEALKLEEREKWVHGVVRGLWEELTATRKVNAGSEGGAVPPVVTHSDWKEAEIKNLNKALDAIEERVDNIRASLQALD